MPAQMVNPATLQLHSLPSTLPLLDGRTAMSDDLDQSMGVLAGWLIPQDIPPVAKGFVRTFASPPWKNAGDGTAAPVYHDESLADIQADAATAAKILADAKEKALVDQQAAFQSAVSQVVPFAQHYRNLLRFYFGDSAETNHEITQAHVLGYFMVLDAEKTITAQQTADAALLQTLFTVLAPLAGDPTVGSENTWSADFWALIP